MNTLNFEGRFYSLWFASNSSTRKSQKSFSVISRCEVLDSGNYKLSRLLNCLRIIVFHYLCVFLRFQKDFRHIVLLQQFVRKARCRLLTKNGMYWSGLNLRKHVLCAKSLHRRHAVSYFYESKFELVAGFGPVAITENVCNSDIVSYFWRIFFSFLHGQHKYKIRISVLRPQFLFFLCQNSLKTHIELWLLEIAHRVTYI